MTDKDKKKIKLRRFLNFIYIQLTFPKKRNK